MQQLSVRALADWLADPGRPRPQLLDVREAWECERCALPNSVTIPMGAVPSRFGELDAGAPLVVVCHHGVRSQQVGAFLESRGFASIYNLAGGIDAWSREIDPSLPTY